MTTITDLKKFMTSQYIYYGIRMTFSVVLPCIILAYFGMLKEYFAFPLGTLMAINVDQPGPFVRRRNTFILTILSFFFISLIIGFSYPYPILVVAEIIIFGMFFSLIGVYGTRLASLGSLSLVVFAILSDGHFAGGKPVETAIIIALGASWSFLLFLIMTKISPYLLIKQILGENFIELGNYLKIKSKFYLDHPNFDTLYQNLMTSQIHLKKHQENLREILFTTRRFINESTTTSRVIMLMFLKSIDLFEQIFTSQQNYKTLQEKFGQKKILLNFHKYILILSEEVLNIGIAVQSNQKAYPIYNLDRELMSCHKAYFKLRNKEMSHENFQDFMMLRQILMNFTEITKKIKTIYRASSYDPKLAKSLSSGLDYERFAPKVEKFNFKLLRLNMSLKSLHFRHAVRITTALVMGYVVSLLIFEHLGHSYWILIAILAIQKPAFSNTKERNLMRLGGTFAGAVVSFAILYYIQDSNILLAILLVSMTLCYAFIKNKYAIAVFFMTMYVFMSFNIFSPGKFQDLFKDRVLDTLIGSAISLVVSYFVLPVWERTQNKNHLAQMIKKNKEYFYVVCQMLMDKDEDKIQVFKEKRKDAIIALANLSDNFQKMISDPKAQQHLAMRRVHQFVNTTQLLTAYIASLSMYAQKRENYTEVDIENWMKKIMCNFIEMQILLEEEGVTEKDKSPFIDYKEPSDKIETLLQKRKREILEKEASFSTHPDQISKLSQLKSINELLVLINNLTEGHLKILHKLLSQENHSDTSAKIKLSNLFKFAEK